MSGAPAGTKLTARLIKSRLDAELVGNVSVRVLPTERPDTWEVQGRGELALAVLVELMRREGFELTVGKPQVLTREINGKLHEPMERVSVDVPEDFMGVVTQLLSLRKGRMETMINHGHTGWCRMEWLVPSRGLIGFRTEFLTETRGTGQLHHVFEGYEPWHGELRTRPNGVMVADRRGPTTAYALTNLQERGAMFVGPGIEVYEGMIVGENARSEDMDVNPTKEKKLTNMRAAAADETVRLVPALQLSLEQALEFIREDECVEVTPAAVRLRKVLLDPAERGRRRAAARRTASLSAPVTCWQHGPAIPVTPMGDLFDGYAPADILGVPGVGRDVRGGRRAPPGCPDPPRRRCRRWRSTSSSPAARPGTGASGTGASPSSCRARSARSRSTWCRASSPSRSGRSCRPGWPSG